VAEKKGPRGCDAQALKAETSFQSAHNRAPAFQSQSPTDAKRVRLQYLARRIHALGERPLHELLIELERGADLLRTLETYAALPAEIVCAYAGDRLLQPRIVGGGA
jgi:hypothetical protein